MRFDVLVAALAAVVVSVLAGCGDDVASAGGDPTRSCPAYAEVTGPVGEAANDRFIVRFADGSDLADDRDARADVLADVGDRLCLDLTEVDLLATGSVLVGTDRLLDPKGQATVTSALERVDGVDYAEVDGVAHPDATTDGSAQ